MSSFLSVDFTIDSSTYFTNKPEHKYKGPVSLSHTAIAGLPLLHFTTFALPCLRPTSWPPFLAFFFSVLVTRYMRLGGFMGKRSWFRFWCCRSHKDGVNILPRGIWWEFFDCITTWQDTTRVTAWASSLWKATTGLLRGPTLMMASNPSCLPKASPISIIAN